jgi:hypothetical protein
MEIVASARDVDTPICLYFWLFIFVFTAELIKTLSPKSAESFNSRIT